MREVIKTRISSGFKDMISVFVKANNLDMIVEEIPGKFRLRLLYDSNSDTAKKIITMSLRNSGFNNMLEDYLLKCGIWVEDLEVGKTPVEIAEVLKSGEFDKEVQ